MATTAVPMDDADLMSGVMSDEPVKQPEQAQATDQQADTTQQGDRARDEQGRFAPKPAETEAVAKSPEQPQAGQEQPKTAGPAGDAGDAQVPSWRLRELREAREAAERTLNDERLARQRLQDQFEQLQARIAAQNRPAPPDIFQSPDEWQRHQAEQFRASVDQVRYDMSETWARDKFGDEKVEAALQWTGQNLDEATRARISGARDPYREMIRLYDERQTLQQIGGDLGAYKNKILEDALNDQAFMQKVADKLRGQASNPSNGNGNTRPAVNIPPSISRMGGGQMAGNSANGLTDADMSDAALVAYAMQR